MKVHIYAVYDMRCPNCESDFLQPSHLCFVGYMCPSVQCDSNIFALGAKKYSDDKKNCSVSYKKLDGC